MIRELQSRSQAKIQVDHSGHSGLESNEKQVTITGTELAVRKATEMVLFLVANPLMDATQSINMLAESKLRGGQWGSGPPYADMPNQGQNMQPDSGGGGYDGYNQQQYYGGAQASGYAPPNGGGGAPVPAPAQYSAYSAAPAAYQQQGSYGQYGSGGVEVEVFYAAKTFMGRIIGQKGCTINDLQRKSACDIQINQDVAPGQDCEITIKGSRQGIEMAKQMLREIIEIGPNHPYAGGNCKLCQVGFLCYCTVTKLINMCSPQTMEAVAINKVGTGSSPNRPMAISSKLLMGKVTTSNSTAPLVTGDHWITRLKPREHPICSLKPPNIKHLRHTVATLAPKQPLLLNGNLLPLPMGKFTTTINAQGRPNGKNQLECRKGDKMFLSSFVILCSFRWFASLSS